MGSSISLFNGDCLTQLGYIEDSSVDLVICDLPFGITSNPWDDQLDMERLWTELLRVGHNRAPFLFFVSGGFLKDVLMSDRENIFRYDIIWNKNLVTGFLNANRQPLRVHEQILVFYRKQPTYNPQMGVGHMTHVRGYREETTSTYGDHGTSRNYSRMKYPTSIVEFDRLRQTDESTQKPLELIEWLVRTYSNEGDTVLDPTMGTGTTMVACKNTGRYGIGMDIRESMIDITLDRIHSDERAMRKVERMKDGF